MTSLDEVTPLAEVTEAALYGSGYANPQQAESAGERWRSVLQVSFARLNIGVDFYERVHDLMGRASDEWLAQLSQEHGRRVVNDQPGVVTYEEPRPLFVSGKAEGVVRPSTRRAAGTFAAADGLRDLEVSELDRLAFEVYAASFYQPSADARLLLAIMAVESLIEPLPRPPAVQEFVDDMMRQVRDSGLPKDQISSLIGSMKWLRNESIGQAGRRVVSVLGERKYHGMSPAKFFTKCYELRSALVHGDQTRPNLQEVDVHASVLQSMVGELLGRRLLHVTEESLAAQEEQGDP